MGYVKVTARYNKFVDGGERYVTEHLLIDAMTLTEAEAKCAEYLKPYIVGDYVAMSAQFTPISEVFIAEGCERFYSAKVASVTIDERNGKEKWAYSRWIIGRDDFEDAYAVVKGQFKQIATCDPELVSLSETNITEYISC